MRASEARAVARLARRTARREWKRTTLVAALVAVPVMVGVVVAGLMRANHVTPEERVTSAFGEAALTVQLWPGEAAGTTHDGDGPPEVAWPQGAKVVDDLVREAAAGAPVIRYRQYYSPHGRVTDLDLTSPLSEGRLTLVEGRAPTTSAEVALSGSIMALHDLKIGDTFTWSDGVDLAVVGRVLDPLHVAEPVTVVTAERLEDLPADEGQGWALWEAAAPQWLVGEVEDPAGFREQVTHGLEAAIPPELAGTPTHDADVPADFAGEQAQVVGPGSPPSVNVGTRAQYLEDVAASHASSHPRRDQVLTPQVIATLVTALLLAEVALIAGAAYATGARRRLREIGLLGSNGATAAHVRGAVVGEATVTGIIGGLVGVLAGIAALTFGRPLAQQFVQPLITHLELSVTDLIGPAIVAVVAVSLAAWLPARTAARVPTTTALQGRMPLSTPRRWITPVGIVLAVFGALLLLVGVVAQGTEGGLVAGVGVLLAIGGTAMLTVPLIAGLGRFADRFPAMLRLVVRDSGRQRTRAAAASASAMVVLIAPVLVATISMSDEHQQLVHGLPYPDNHVFVPPDEGAMGYPGGPGVAAVGHSSSTSDRAAVLAEVREELPRSVRAEVTVLDQRAAVAPAPQFSAIASAESLVDASRPESDEAFWFPGESWAPHVAIGTVELADALGQPDVAAALADGQVVVLGITDRATSIHLAGRDLPAVEMPVEVLYGFPRVLVSPGLADDLGLGVAGTADLLVTSTPIDQSTAETLYRTINGMDIAVGSNGFRNGPMLRWLAVAATLVVALVILALVTMLSATESDHDLRTMVAVGGPPRMRRRFLGLQSAVHAAVGAILATPLALALAWATMSSQDFTLQGPFGAVESSSLWVDWSVVGGVVVGVPLVIGLAIALLVQSAPTVPPRRLG